MIVTRTPDGLRVTMQVAHQAQCGRLAAAWGNADVRRPEPWDPVACAAEWHDEGWRMWERVPGVTPGGAPRGFSEMGHLEHVAIHRRSVAACERYGDAVTLLVGMHGAGLVMHRMGLDGEMPTLSERPAVVRSLFTDSAHAMRAARGRMGEGRAVGAWAWAAYRVLQALDLLSLYLTWRGLEGGESWTLRRVPRLVGDEAGVSISVTRCDDLICTLDPWPFTLDVVDAPVECCVIPDRRYASGDDLRDALMGATPQVIPYRIVRV